jgi:hypothetical protein
VLRSWRVERNKCVDKNYHPGSLLGDVIDSLALDSFDHLCCLVIPIFDDWYCLIMGPVG